MIYEYIRSLPYPKLLISQQSCGELDPKRLNLIKNEWGKGIIEFTPLICMMYIGVYFYDRSSSIDDILLFFADYLVKSRKKKSREDATLFLEKHIKYLTELNKKGKSRLSIPEKGLKEENTLHDGIVEMQREL